VERKVFFRDLMRVIGLLGRHKLPYLFALTVCSVVDPIYQIAFALANGRLLNAIETGQMSLLISSLWLVGGVLLFHFVVQPITAYHYEVRIYHPIIDIKLGLLKRIVELPLARLEGMHSGDLLTRVSQDVDDLSEFYLSQAYDLLSKTIWGVGSIAAMFLLSPIMAALMISLGALTAVANTAYAKTLAGQAERERSSLSRCNEILADMLPGLRVIKSLNKERHFAGKYAAECAKWAEHSLSRSKTTAHRASIGFLLSSASFLGGLVFAAYLVALGRLDFGSALSVILLQSGVTNMFIHMGSFYGEMQATFAGARRIFEILDEQSEEEGVITDPTAGCRSESGIRYSNVTFTYPDGKTVLKDFNLSVDQGTVTALVGPSGGGKSTVAKLLLGLYRPEKGQITIDGVDTSQISLSALREQVAYVPQDVFLFSDTIAENIRVGRADATDQEVVEAARKACAHDFIMEQPLGYHTRIGDGGSNLSGGQQQRIAIARAILKDAPVILLDEATSAVDAETERELQETLRDVTRGKTVVVVAHRPSASEWADQVLTVSRASSYS
jgi:ATP-binding cassette subfamily B protein